MLKFTAKLVFYAMCVGLARAMLDPSIAADQLKSSLPDTVKMITQDIGRTVNGYTIMAYGLTSIPEMPDHPEPEALKNYPSSLITSFMGWHDEHSVNLLFVYLSLMFKNLTADYYLQYVLKHGFIWIVPYVNIDAYETLVRNNKDDSIFTSEELKDYGKNMNKYSSPDGMKCNSELMAGVNIDANFMKNAERDPCSPSYGGPQQFSQAQTRALESMFTMFNITVLVDLKSYGDYWLLPNSEAGADGKSTHAFLYQNIRKKLSAKNYKVLLAETNKNGGFISWANRQGALALAHFIGRSSHMPLEQLKSSAMQSVPVIDMLIKKNSPIYQKYRNLQKSLLFIQSLSVIPFELSCKITCESQSLEINKNYVLRPDEKIEIATLFNQKWQSSEKMQIILSVLGSRIQEDIDMDQLEVLHVENKQKSEGGYAFYVAGFIIVVFVGLTKFWRRKQNKFSKLPDEQTVIFRQA